MIGISTGTFQIWLFNNVRRSDMVNSNLIGHEVKILSNLIKKRSEGFKSIFDTKNLTVIHGLIIEYVYYNRSSGDIFQRDLESVLSIRRSTATEILQRMEKNGMILRETVNYDARLKKIILTSKANEIYEEVHKELYKIDAELSNGISKEERRFFLTMIEKIKRNIE